ncbi:DUF1454 family protein [Providencia sneebia]|uniref:DUF1454 family protein n=1 Tax=Providencia sneebia DSM 19967 TaxID=1141660 RepID=K8WKW6_9GAMM|nr:DUF1454 family protein [Providencia sneebia]EKT61253.1 hypothetical protein OO7_01071 [Providencia sneebia DSM 19967]
MKRYTLRTIHCIITVFVLSLPHLTFAQKVPTLPNSDFEVAYLSADAPSFELTIPQFRQQFSQANPDLPLHEYKVISSQDISAPYIRAVSRINPNIYSSAVLERGSEKIKSLQITLLSTESAEENKKNQEIIERYILALVQQFTPTTHFDKSVELTKSLNKFNADKSQTLAEEARVDTVRYVLVKSDNNVLTFAVEPIKLETETP